MDGLFARSDVDTVMWVDSVGFSTDDTYVIPAGKTLAVAGDVDLNGADIVINAFNGTLDLSTGTIAGSDANDVILLNTQNASAKANITVAAVPALVSGITAGDTIPADGAIVSSLAIGAGSGAIALADFETYATSARVYVLGALDISGDAAFSAAKLTVFGNTTTNGDIELTSDTVLRGKLTVTDDKTITGLDNFKGVLDIGDNDVIADDATAVELAALNGSGTLDLQANLTSVKIGDGTGSILASGSSVTLGAGSVFKNTGLTTFGPDVSVTAGVEFAGLVDFEGALDTGTGETVFNKTASFVDTELITTSTGAIKLAANESLALMTSGGTPTRVPIITAGAGGLTLTPGTGTTLTFDEAGKSITQDTAGVVIGGSAILATSAAYTVAAGQTLVVDAGGTFTVNGDLAIGDGLILTGAAGTGGAVLKGVVEADNTTIAGGTNGWRAVGTGTITIAADAITASISTVALTGMAGTVAPSITVATAERLTVTGQINISTAGTVTLTTGVTPASLALTDHATNFGLLVVDTDNTTALDITGGAFDATNFYLTDSSKTGDSKALILSAIDTDTAVGGNAAANLTIQVASGTTGNASSGLALGRIGGGTGNDVYIKGGTSANSVIAKDWLVTAPHS
jgi:hypothetical protein